MSMTTPNLDLLLDVALDVSAEIGGCRMRMAEIMALGPGAIVEFTRGANEPVDLLVNGRVVARGEIVAVDDRFGLRITHLVEAS